MPHKARKAGVRAPVCMTSCITRMTTRLEREVGPVDSSLSLYQLVRAGESAVRKKQRCRRPPLRR